MVNFHFGTPTHKIIRRLIITFSLCLTIFLAATPAFAMGSSQAKPSEGIAQLDKIEQRSKDVLKEGPRGMQEVQERAKGGINAVQGGADQSKMNTPENSKEAVSVIDQVKDALSDLGN